MQPCRADGRAISTAKFALDVGLPAAAAPAAPASTLSVTMAARQRAVELARVPSFLQEDASRAAAAAAGQCGGLATWGSQAPQDEVPPPSVQQPRPATPPASTTPQLPQHNSSSSSAGPVAANPPPTCLAAHSPAVPRAPCIHQGASGSPASQAASTAVEGALRLLHQLQAGSPVCSGAAPPPAGSRRLPRASCLQILAGVGGDDDDAGSASPPCCGSPAPTLASVPRLKLPASPFAAIEADAAARMVVRFLQAPGRGEDGAAAASGCGHPGRGAMLRSRSLAASTTSTRSPAAQSFSNGMTRSASSSAVDALAASGTTGSGDDALDSLLRSRPLALMEQRGFAQDPHTYRAQAQASDAARYLGTVVAQQQQQRQQLAGTSKSRGRQPPPR